ncbi:MAG: M3 family metallopeptidase [Kiritimatiellaeota bacterium]|nr:M3 family metallopeptidase [Kiritimatiellota bacterium]
MSLKSNPMYNVGEFPAYDKIKAEHAVPAVEARLAEAEKAVAKIERQFATDAGAKRATYDSRITALTDATRPLWQSYGLIWCFTALCNSEEWRVVEKALQPKIVAFSTRVAQSKPLYKALVALRESPDYDKLESAQKRIIEAELRGAKHSGIALEGKKREEFNKILLKLSALSTKFADNVLDATRAFSMSLTKKSELKGLPDTVLAATKQADGSHKITLDGVVSGPFMQYSERRDLRRKLYMASVSRASSGKSDNTKVIDKILRLRVRLSKILGYDNYAQISCSEKMSGVPAKVYEMVERVAKVAVPKAKEEFAALEKFAGCKIKPWDFSYWATKQSEALFGYTSEQLRPYFQFEKAMDGMFALTEKLFGVKVVAADGEHPVWHKDARFFKVLDKAGKVVSYIYFDPYSRSETKRGGAWCGDAQQRRKLPDGTIVLSIAHMVCNHAGPVGDKPSCITLGDVGTLFHEFGHASQVICTKVDYPEVSCFCGVEHDAIELASQFFDNWLKTPGILKSLSCHVDTGEQLPDKIIAQIEASRKHNAAIGTLRQLLYTTVDMDLHTEFPNGKFKTPAAAQAAAYKRFSVLAPVKEDHFINAFSHIFAGGYSAGYYSYMWADVLASDAYAAFGEVGFENDKEIRKLGKRYTDTILALGGSLHPSEVFRMFRGRDPDPDAFLRARGLL